MRHCRARQNKEEEEEERDRVSRMSDAKMQENRGCQDFCSRGREGSRARAGANARVKHHACMCMSVSIRRERENTRTREREHDAEYLVFGNSVGTERRQQRGNSLG